MTSANLSGSEQTGYRRMAVAFLASPKCERSTSPAIWAVVKVKFSAAYRGSVQQKKCEYLQRVTVNSATLFTSLRLSLSLSLSLSACVVPE